MGRWDSEVLLKAAFCHSHSLPLPVFLCKSIQSWVPVLDWGLLCVLYSASGGWLSGLHITPHPCFSPLYRKLKCKRQPYRLSTYGLMFAIWSCMDRQTHSIFEAEPFTCTKSSHVLYMLLYHSLIEREKWATKKQKILKCLRAVLCSTC